ncbi:arginine--tRNA ligase [Patescibacteria group bacterium]|nr:arginine--tRNA ligase [Patescibacteria group bacterium]MBU1123205.1 arginine--tRNA ligase [Patescibacteria group bacterium]MBU1911803.1 arginine--tRNA ligase [Patescibacteria group bacterium]
MYNFLSTLAQDILNSNFGIEPDVTWEYSSDGDKGDASTAVALQVSKKAGKKPQEIAQVLCDKLAEDESVERAEIAGPGYVNVWLTHKALLKSLNSTREACIAQVKRDEPPVIIDYCGPNIAKPLGIHHILPHVIGQAIINIYKHQGFNVIGWSYPGDWGTQFGKLAVAFEKWGEGKKAGDCSVEELLDLYVKFHNEVENDPSLEDQARESFKKLEGGDKKMHMFWKEVVKVSEENLKNLYKRLNINPDEETGESFYQDKMDPIIEEGTKRGVFIEGEGGALIAEFTEESGLPPFMMKKSDGSTLYGTRDLAMIRYRIDQHHPQAIYYVVDRAQSLHFRQLFETCNKLEWELPELEHTVFGRMSFGDKKMSTRKGTVLRLEEVLDEAEKRAEAIITERGDEIQADDRSELAEMMGLGALVYGVLSQNRKMDIVFDWDKFLSFEGNSAPYLQYTHARTKSVLRKSEQEEFVMPSDIKELADKERSLLNLLLQFARVLDEAREARMPHILTNYLYALCQSYNTFYNSEPILKAEEQTRSLRLSLTSLTASVLKTGAELLTIRVPDRM